MICHYWNSFHLYTVHFLVKKYVLHCEGWLHLQVEGNHTYSLWLFIYIYKELILPIKLPEGVDSATL